MARLAPKTEALRALFARSGNRCAYPGCTSPLINDRNQFIAQVCHIEAAVEGGERFNFDQTDEQRRGYANLILLCYPHHIETNEVETYPVARLWEMKAAHEGRFEQTPFKINESLLYKIADEMEQYWRQVEELHRNHHIVSELAIEIDAKASFMDLAQQANKYAADVIWLRDMVQESDDSLLRDMTETLKSFGASDQVIEERQHDLRPFGIRNWEVLNLGFANTIAKLRVVLAQMELKYLEEFLKLNPTDRGARLRMEALKKEFATMATSAGYAD